MEGICGCRRPNQFRARHSGGLWQGRGIREEHSLGEESLYNAVFEAIRIQGLCESRNSATIEYLTNPDNAAWPSCPSDLAAFFPTARRAIPLAKASRDPQGDVRYWHLADIDLCAANVCF
jgi:hypothetical protein